MPVKMIDLQLIYGIAGAREKFEDLATLLIKAEQPTAEKVRTERGDGGIDVFVGDVSDPNGIEIYQCKFLPQGLGDSQKSQIRQSFERCHMNKAFKTKRWTVCLPVDLTLLERKWFNEWRVAQSTTGIEIREPWNATKLESLLYQPQNQIVRELFFKEEHLRQIGEIHAMLSSLISEIVDRLSSGKNEVHTTNIASMENAVEASMVRTRARLSNVVESIRQFLPQSQRLGLWEIVFYPIPTGSLAEVDSLGTCWKLVTDSRTTCAGWSFPFAFNERESGEDWIGSTCGTLNGDPAAWQISELGIFDHLSVIWNDLQPTRQQFWRPDHTGFVPSYFFDIDEAIRVLTLAFRFASKIVKQVEYPMSEHLGVRVALTETENRVLSCDSDSSLLTDRYKASEPSLNKAWQYDTNELKLNADDLAVKTAKWIFERFNWIDAEEKVLQRIQSEFFSRT